MKNILLVCELGMSTNMLVNKMNSIAKNKKVEIELHALPVAECESVINEVDIVLVSPQAKFQTMHINSLVNGRVPVKSIDTILYGTMDAETILNQTLNLLDKR